MPGVAIRFIPFIISFFELEVARGLTFDFAPASVSDFPGRNVTLPQMILTALQSQVL
jgi:hypothetical protein